MEQYLAIYSAIASLLGLLAVTDVMNRHNVPKEYVYFFGVICFISTLAQVFLFREAFNPIMLGFSVVGIGVLALSMNFLRMWGDADMFVAMGLAFVAYPIAFLALFFAVGLYVVYRTPKWLKNDLRRPHEEVAFLPFIFLGFLLAWGGVCLSFGRLAFC